jgi:hypothetical protein
MKESEKFVIIIAEIDLFLIEKVRYIRLNNNPKISQVALSQMMGLADGFVGKVENLKESSKYNLWHINKIIKVLKLKFTDIFPPNAINNDIIKAEIRFIKRTKKDEKSYEILSVSPLSEFEMELFKRNKLPYISLGD